MHTHPPTSVFVGANLRFTQKLPLSEDPVALSSTHVRDDYRKMRLTVSGSMKRSHFAHPSVLRLLQSAMIRSEILAESKFSCLHSNFKPLFAAHSLLRHSIYSQVRHKSRTEPKYLNINHVQVLRSMSQYSVVLASSTVAEK